MSERIVIAGCRGRMGAMLMERLGGSEAFSPVGLDLPYEPEAMKEACKGARVVLLCIPATAIPATLEKLLPFMEPSAILSDITSVKELPMRHMESLWNGPVVGTHPLFGPVPAQDLELRVTIVPGSRASEEDVAFVESLFHSFSCVTFRATAEEHDMAEAKIQGMNFITSAAYFAMTAEDPALLPYITPSFLRRMNSTEKQLMEDGPLFTWLFEANPHSQAMVRQYRNLLSLAAAGDVDLILRKAQWWWKDGAGKEKLHEEARKVALQSARAGLKKGKTS
ncbi:prephenate dehydrogenase/arogenate dehydrogenase family protein [Mailhella massiliensis]|uniref:Prephenate dehydrogenase/arogenate dehydrogenase family protein n=1 Tax=Mailhella massiliensis TaxID=1903261 RepID=A0A921AX31_9BACT|nr:prephenate dehydrogenase/arogenate dehydrogenase family protein [Mailhella massiliensis]HJD97432.1 prephenate dehydrogenase/arogenate dehydrogenase family protein [Mailhella massiliensis]